MLKKNLYKILLLLWLAVIFTLSLVSLKVNINTGRKIPQIDKVVHFSFYFVLSWIIIRVLLLEIKSIKSFKFSAFITLVTSSSIGILIEWLQSHYTRTRHGDVKDVVFNIFGTVVAIFLTYLVTNTKKQ